MGLTTTGTTAATGRQHIIAANATHGLGALDAFFLAWLEVIGIALDILEDTGLFIFLFKAPERFFQRFVSFERYFYHVHQSMLVLEKNCRTNLYSL